MWEGWLKALGPAGCAKQATVFGTSCLSPRVEERCQTIRMYQDSLEDPTRETVEAKIPNVVLQEIGCGADCNDVCCAWLEIKKKHKIGCGGPRSSKDPETKNHRGHTPLQLARNLPG